MYSTTTVVSYPGLYFPPENEIEEDPYKTKYHFTIGNEDKFDHPLLANINKDSVETTIIPMFESQPFFPTIPPNNLRNYAMNKITKKDIRKVTRKTTLKPEDPSSKHDSPIKRSFTTPRPKALF